MRRETRTVCAKPCLDLDDAIHLLTCISSDSATVQHCREQYLDLKLSQNNMQRYAFDTPAAQTARMFVHSIHAITKATTLTLEVQGGQTADLAKARPCWRG